MKLTNDQITRAVAAGLSLYSRELPYDDGLFYLKIMLNKLNEGSYGLIHTQRNAEGELVPAPEEGNE